MDPTTPQTPSPPRLPPHRVPLTWLVEHGSESIRYRAVRDLAPPGQPGLEVMARAVAESPMAVAVAERQAADGAWGKNLHGITPSARDGIPETGTIAQYRRLIELGYPAAGRPFKLADRLLFRFLSRDDDPALLFEYGKTVSVAPQAEEWVRDLAREAATCALAEAGHFDDPRVRGAAHKIATGVSQFLRSPLSENPFNRSGSKQILNPEARPPSWYSVAMVAAMPNLRRERAGFVGRLGQYLSQNATRRTFVIPVGRKSVKPTHLLLGDPMHAKADGSVKDLPLALHFIELVARLGVATESSGVTRVLDRLYRECDEQGVWRPKRLASAPRAVSPQSYHCYPLQDDTSKAEGRAVDVTFRLALIAKLLGRPLEYT